ncbi:MAG: DUF6232 family protein [Acidobacteriota bacterium]
MEETTFFEDHNVKVTNARLISFGKTYAMNALVSVRSDTQKPSFGGAAVLLLFGILALVIGLSAGETGVGVVGAGLMLAGILVARSKKPTYRLFVTTASGEVEALSSKDWGYLSKVLEAVNNAIVARG